MTCQEWLKKNDESKVACGNFLHINCGLGDTPIECQGCQLQILDGGGDKNIIFFPPQIISNPIIPPQNKLKRVNLVLFGYCWKIQCLPSPCNFVVHSPKFENRSNWSSLFYNCWTLSAPPPNCWTMVHLSHHLKKRARTPHPIPLTGHFYKKLP